MDKRLYLKKLTFDMSKIFPKNRRINIVVHGHSQTCGFTANHVIDPFSAYPYQFHRLLVHRFPMAMINMIGTGIGGENSISGQTRFSEEVLCHKPDLILLDYGLNDRYEKLSHVKEAWRQMTYMGCEKSIPMLLLTPTLDLPSVYSLEKREKISELQQMIQDVGKEFSVGVADITERWSSYLTAGGQIEDLLCTVNHASYEGHKLIAQELNSWVPSLEYKELSDLEEW